MKFLITVLIFLIIQAECIRWRMFSDNNSILFTNHKQEALLFKNKELKRWNFNFWKDTTVQFAWNSASLPFSGYLRFLQIQHIYMFVQKLFQKWHFRCYTGLSWLNLMTLSCFLRSYSLVLHLFPRPFSTGKSLCICPRGQKWHQQLSHTNHHKPFSAAPRNEAQSKYLETKFQRELHQFFCT